MKLVSTFEQNQQQKHFHDRESVWLFGYGSLIYKVDFPFIEKRPAKIQGWQRRFWQASIDHRGTPENPGRVATLVKNESAICEGMAYLVTHDVFEHLDHREKNGYLRVVIEILFDDHNLSDGLTYIAAESNPAFIGEEPVDVIAQRIASSSGPSGTNAEYLLELANALRELGAYDEHVFAIESALKK